jgi:hypothetical protein
VALSPDLEYLYFGVNRNPCSWPLCVPVPTILAVVDFAKPNFPPAFDPGFDPENFSPLLPRGLD